MLPHAKGIMLCVIAIKAGLYVYCRGFKTEAVQAYAQVGWFVCACWFFPAAAASPSFHVASKASRLSSTVGGSRPRLCRPTRRWAVFCCLWLLADFPRRPRLAFFSSCRGFKTEAVQAYAQVGCVVAACWFSTAGPASPSFHLAGGSRRRQCRPTLRFLGLARRPCLAFFSSSCLFRLAFLRQQLPCSRYSFFILLPSSSSFSFLRSGPPQRRHDQRVRPCDLRPPAHLLLFSSFFIAQDHRNDVMTNVFGLVTALLGDRVSGRKTAPPPYLSLCFARR